MTAIPLMIELREKNVVIVGGGPVAEKRVNILLDTGAYLTIISPVIENGIRSEWEKGRLNWEQKTFEANDVANAFLVIVATNDPIVNQSVIESAPTNSLINAAARADKGNVEFPSFFRRGKLAISISTSGASPQLSAKLNSELQALYDDSYEDYLEFLYESRQLIKHSLFDKSQQKLLLKELLSKNFLNKDKQRKAIKWFKKVSRG